MEKLFLFRKAFIFFACLAALSCISCKTGAWQSSLEEAKKEAFKKNQNILLFASDSSSEDFKKEVLDSKEFIKAAKNYVLLHIDLSPAGLEKKSAEVLEAQKEEYKNAILTYDIRLDKSLYLLSQEGYVLNVVPYSPNYTDAKTVFDAVSRAEREASRFLPILQAVRGASDSLLKVQAIDELFEATDEAYRRALYPLCQELLLLDAENKSGLLGKYELFLAHINVEPYLHQETIEKASAVFTDLCKTGHLDVHQQFLAYYEAAYVHTLVEDIDFDAVLTLLQKAYDVLALEKGAKEIADIESAMDTVRAMQKLKEASGRTSE